MTITIELDDEIIEFFQTNVDDTMPLYELLPKMLHLFKEVLETSK